MLYSFLSKWKRVRGEGEGASYEVLTVRIAFPSLPFLPFLPSLPFLPFPPFLNSPRPPPNLRTRRLFERADPGPRRNMGTLCVQVVDTILAKLHAQSEQTQSLYSLIRTSPYLVLSELEPVLKTTGQYKALCTLYGNRGEDGKMLEVWAKCVSVLFGWILCLMGC